MRRWQATLLELGRLTMGPEYPGPAGAFARPVEVPVNALLLRRANEAVLIDAGSGIGDAWWPGAAGLGQALADAACDPSTISRVVLTHLDFDHAGGALRGRWPDELEPAFAGARIAVLCEGLDEWRRRDPAAPFNVGTRLLSSFGAWQRLDELEDGDEAAPGIRLLSAPGHRAGHACVDVDGRLLHLADVVHHPLHIAHPEWDPEFDARPDLARATRLRWLTRAADSGVTVVHSHVAGTGRIRRGPRSFEWEPAGGGA